MDQNLKRIAREADQHWDRLQELNEEALRLLGLSPHSPRNVLNKAVAEQLSYIGLTPAREQVCKWIVEKR